MDSIACLLPSNSLSVQAGTVAAEAAVVVEEEVVATVVAAVEEDTAAAATTMDTVAATTIGGDTLPQQPLVLPLLASPLQTRTIDPAYPAARRP